MAAIAKCKACSSRANGRLGEHNRTGGPNGVGGRGRLERSVRDRIVENGESMGRVRRARGLKFSGDPYWSGRRAASRRDAESTFNVQLFDGREDDGMQRKYRWNYRIVQYGNHTLSSVLSNVRNREGGDTRHHGLDLHPLCSKAKDRSFSSNFVWHLNHLTTTPF